MCVLHIRLGNKSIIVAGNVLAYLDDVSEHVALKEVSPERPWHLGETKTEGQQEGQPQVVGGHGSILQKLKYSLASISFRHVRLPIS